MTHAGSLAILGPDGALARSMPGYESRPQQLEMADAVARAINAKSHLVVEAGTGVGKSFAYLVPALLAAVERDLKVVVSTRTIPLQEQLFHKDIPALRQVLPFDFNVELVKGRGNYISLRRLDVALGRGLQLFDGADLESLRSIRDWSKQTPDGSRSDLSFNPTPDAWDAVASDHGNCLGRACPRHRACFYFAATRRARAARLLVVNHALYLADLALQRQGGSLLPEHDVAIFDEAHALEPVAARSLGVQVASGTVLKLLSRLSHERSGRGLLFALGILDPVPLVRACRLAAERFFEATRSWLGPAPGARRAKQPIGVANPLSEPLRVLSSAIQAESGEVPEPERLAELDAACARCDQIADDLDGWLDQRWHDSAYWVETTGGPSRRGLLLAAAPLDVGPILREELFRRVPSCVLTSATLAVGRPASFRFVRSRVGLDAAEELALGSPFDYANAAVIRLVKGLPDPSAGPEAFEAAAIAAIPHYVRMTAGHALVLFTSHRMLRAAESRLRPWFEREGLTLLAQGESLPRSKLIEHFKADPSSVLFGADSFWEGIDVPGAALSNLIITRLPFTVPTEPLAEARRERLERAGGRWFDEATIPETILKLKQGFGRLIRSQADRGMVVLLDPRVLTKSYGRGFLDSLPPCPRVVDDARDLAAPDRQSRPQ